MKDGGIRIIARVLRTLQRQEVIKGEEEMMQLIKYTLAKIIEAEHICTQALNDGREISFQDTYQQEGSIMLDLFEEEIYFSFLEIINELKNNKDYYCPKNILQIHGPRDAIEDIIAENKDLPKFFGDFIRGIDFNFESKTKYAIEIAAQGLIEQSFIEGVSRVKETYKEDLFDEVNRTIYNLQDEAIEAIKFYEDLSKKDEASFSQEDKEIYSNQKKFIAALESLQSDLGNYNFAIIYTDQYAKGDLKPEQIEGLNFIKEYSCKNGYIDPLPNNTEAALRPIVKRFYVLSS